MACFLHQVAQGINLYRYQFGQVLLYTKDKQYSARLVHVRLIAWIEFPLFMSMRYLASLEPDAVARTEQNAQINAHISRTIGVQYASKVPNKSSSFSKPFKQKERTKAHKRGKRADQSDIIYCAHCGNQGHSEDQCFHLVSAGVLVSGVLALKRAAS